MEIKIDDLSGPEIAELLQAHLLLMRSQSPACSVHALDLDGLRVPDITFWSAWVDDELVGCVALKEHDDKLGEIKSMHTRKELRGKGAAAKLLNHLENQARDKGLKRLSLETGSQDEFGPARSLYAKHGYSQCDPFADYWDDPNSYYMTKVL